MQGGHHLRPKPPPLLPHPPTLTPTTGTDQGEGEPPRLPTRPPPAAAPPPGPDPHSHPGSAAEHSQSASSLEGGGEAGPVPAGVPPAGPVRGGGDHGQAGVPPPSPATLPPGSPPQQGTGPQAGSEEDSTSRFPTPTTTTTSLTTTTTTGSGHPDVEQQPRQQRAEDGATCLPLAPTHPAPLPPAPCPAPAPPFTLETCLSNQASGSEESSGRARSSLSLHSSVTTSFTTSHTTLQRLTSPPLPSTLGEGWGMWEGQRQGKEADGGGSRGRQQEGGAQAAAAGQRAEGAIRPGSGFEAQGGITLHPLGYLAPGPLALGSGEEAGAWPDSLPPRPLVPAASGPPLATCSRSTQASYATCSSSLSAFLDDQAALAGPTWRHRAGRWLQTWSQRPTERGGNAGMRGRNTRPCPALVSPRTTTALLLLVLLLTGYHLLTRAATSPHHDPVLLLLSLGAGLLLLLLLGTLPQWRLLPAPQVQPRYQQLGVVWEPQL
ncbi:hypothetical protein V8C86DRAFT_3095224 [Haematococcus lacustris]